MYSPPPTPPTRGGDFRSGTNYQYGQQPNSKNIFADVFLDRYFTKKLPDGSYKGWNLACAKAVDNITLKYGPQAGKLVSVDGPEYETAGAVTCMGIFDPQFIVEYNWYCDEYGLDTISMGVNRLSSWNVSSGAT